MLPSGIPEPKPIAARPGVLKRPAGTQSFLIVIGVGAIASVLALVVGARPLFREARTRERANAAAATDRRKAGRVAGVTVVIAPPLPRQGPERVAREGGIEPLASGERIRIGIEPGPRQFYFVVSVEDGGRVVPWYPELGVSLALPESGAIQYLPEPIELGGRGRERLVVLLTSEPLELDEIRREVAAALSRVGGDITRMPKLTTSGDQFHRMFDKG